MGFGQGSKPFYGGDYEFVSEMPYVDVSLTGNADYIQPYVSFGLQFEHLNVGLANALVIARDGSGAHYIVGPELGYMQNLNSLIYVKENNSYMGFDGPFSFSCTFSLGLNL